MWKSFCGRMSGGHLRPLAATRVAASGCKWLPVTRECWRPLAATCGHSSGCKRLQVAAGDKRMLAATCGHLRPLEWLQVAASGCILHQGGLNPKSSVLYINAMNKHEKTMKTLISSLRLPKKDVQLTPVGQTFVHFCDDCKAILCRFNRLIDNDIPVFGQARMQRVKAI